MTREQVRALLPEIMPEVRAWVAKDQQFCRIALETGA